MKRVLTLILMGLFAVLTANAQSLEVQNADMDKTVFKAHQRGVYKTIIQNRNQSARSANCGPDSLYYGQFKASGFGSLFLDSGVGFSQWFDAPNPVTISGTTIYTQGVATDGTLATLECKLYAASTTGKAPTGTALATATVQVDTGNLVYFVDFTTPVTVTTPYVIAVENVGDSSVVAVWNSWSAADGAAEANSSIFTGGAWASAITFNVGGTALDADLIVEPYVTYSINEDFGATDSACFLRGKSIDFFSFGNSPIAKNQYYNLYSFAAAFLGDTDSTFSYDFGDGSPLAYGETPAHVYGGTATSTNVGLFTEIIGNGIGVGCNDSRSKTYVIGDTAKAGFTYMVSNSQTVEFTSTATDATSISYDFGDGSTSTLDSPTHVYTSGGTYTVTMTATGCGEVSTTSSEVIVLLNTAIDALLDERLEVYPNPAKGQINVRLALDKAEPVSISLSNIYGQEVQAMTVSNQVNVQAQMDISNLAAGIYMVNVEMAGRKAIRKLIVE